jgi:hypothetical protein
VSLNGCEAEASSESTGQVQGPNALRAVANPGFAIPTVTRGPGADLFVWPTQAERLAEPLEPDAVCRRRPE